MLDSWYNYLWVGGGVKKITVLRICINRSRLFDFKYERVERNGGAQT